MNLADRAYIAGIIDGEGTITLVRKHINENYSPEVSVANTNLNLLNWLKKKTDGGVILKKQKRSERHSDAYTWKLRGNKALDLLSKVQELLIIKKQHAELLLRNYKEYTPRNGRYTSEQLQNKMKLVAEIRKLNSR